jgi:hypothetical protein
VSIIEEVSTLIDNFLEDDDVEDDEDDDNVEDLDMYEDNVEVKDVMVDADTFFKYPSLASDVIDCNADVQ